MRPQRYHLRIGVGNLLEVCGAAAAVYGLARLAGFAYGLILLGILLVFAAELIYDGTMLRVPLPHRPRPIRRMKAVPARIERWRWDRRVRKLVRNLPSAEASEQ